MNLSNKFPRNKIKKRNPNINSQDKESPRKKNLIMAYMIYARNAHVTIPIYTYT